MWQLGGHPSADLHLKWIICHLHKSFPQLTLFAKPRYFFGMRGSVCFTCPAVATADWLLIGLLETQKVHVSYNVYQFLHWKDAKFDLMAKYNSLEEGCLTQGNAAMCFRPNRHRVITTKAGREKKIGTLRLGYAADTQVYRYTEELMKGVGPGKMCMEVRWYVDMEEPPATKASAPSKGEITYSYFIFYISTCFNEKSIVAMDDAVRILQRRSVWLRSAGILGQVTVFTFYFKGVSVTLQCVVFNVTSENSSPAELLQSESSFHSVFHSDMYRINVPHTVCTHAAPHLHAPISLDFSVAVVISDRST